MRTVEQEHKPIKTTADLPEPKIIEGEWKFWQGHFLLGCIRRSADGTTETVSEGGFVPRDGYIWLAIGPNDEYGFGWSKKDAKNNAKTPRQVKHTETPWNIFRNEDGIDHIGTGTRKVVAFPWNKFENDDEANVEDEANAEFIVRAVNCHEELLDACKAAREVLGKQPYHPRDAAADAAFDLCNVAIARAEGR